jgi:hypothetical protein
VRRAVVRALLALSVALSGGAALAGQSAPRAVWIWEGETAAMLEHDGAALDAIDFLKAKGIGTAYLYADAWRGRNAVADGQAMRRLLRRMHAQGLRVQALLGSGYLHTERYVLPQHRKEALAMVARVLDYNRAAAPTSRAGCAARCPG